MNIKIVAVQPEVELKDCNTRLKTRIISIVLCKDKLQQSHYWPG